MNCLRGTPSMNIGILSFQRRFLHTLRRPFIFPKPLKGPKCKNVVAEYEKKYQNSVDVNGERFQMFHRSQKDRVRPGAVLLVESYSKYPLKESINRFAGYLLRVRHRGPKSSFLLRNNVMGVGVEVLFPIYSPQIKSITVLKDNGISKRPRRAYLSYLRQPRFRLAPVEPLVRKYMEAKRK
ncbi:ribosomal protein subunit L19 [Schizosaccharomyces cryophilus OY26]|uniref:Ribosomal protein subunit L19 n=1 Tax=Schizosaccharomyces cryophilus (strain OY26 / ATCC MYA-4695 / CBS 11777 / NBRC 106824 / NRRL Y48691) TaxID=653667 RepID=S9WYA4_SCHCR|nr:ribosomal protein subunit L19 [Schizosaccharomyces cryophilus OY26]EPY49712.1 ribosomal protein subunit L19 [Schizosaccharomyces cryophilus OY26]